jgi:hypothetical protein
VADVVDRVIAGHVLLLQEIRGVALTLGENRDENIRARHFFAARRLNMDDRALDDTLEPGRRLGIVRRLHHQIFEFAVDVLDKIALQLVDVDIARTHHGGRVLIVRQREQ